MIYYVLEYIFYVFLNIAPILIPMLGSIILFQVMEHFYRHLPIEVKQENAIPLIILRVTNAAVLVATALAAACSVWGLDPNRNISDICVGIILIGIIICFILSVIMIIRLYHQEHGLKFAVSPMLNIILYIYYIDLIYTV